MNVKKEHKPTIDNEFTKLFSRFNDAIELLDAKGDIKKLLERIIYLFYPTTSNKKPNLKPIIAAIENANYLYIDTKLGDDKLKWDDLSNFIHNKLKDKAFKELLIEKWPVSMKGDPYFSLFDQLTSWLSIIIPPTINIEEENLTSLLTSNNPPRTIYKVIIRQLPKKRYLFSEMIPPTSSDRRYIGQISSILAEVVMSVYESPNIKITKYRDDYNSICSVIFNYLDFQPKLLNLSKSNPRMDIAEYLSGIYFKEKDELTNLLGLKNKSDNKIIKQIDDIKYSIKTLKNVISLLIFLITHN